MAVNPYATTRGAAENVARLGVAKVEALLAKAEREVKRRSDASFRAGMDASARRRANLRASLTTACETRDLYQMALEIARARPAAPEGKGTP